MSAYIGLGITQGAKAIQQHERGRATREAQQAAAMNQKQLSEMKLNEYKQNAPLREQQNEQAIAESRQLARQANQQNLKSITYSAFDKYEADGDVRHLNNMLRDVKKNPIGAKAGSNITRYDELTDTPQIRQMMSKAGYSDFEGIMGNDQLRKSFVVTTDTGGELQVWDVDKVYAASGYGKHMTNEKLEEAKKRAQLSELVRKGESVSSVQAKENAIQSMMKAEVIPYHEAYRRISEINEGGSRNADSAAIRAISEDEGISLLEATEKYYGAKNGEKSVTDQQRYVDSYLKNNPDATHEEAVGAYKSENRTADSKNIEEAEASKDALNEMNFLETDLTTLSATDRANVHRHVAKIERLMKTTLSTEEKSTMRDLNNLAKLGAVAGEELTPQETGLLDSMLNSVKKYMFDEVGGSVGTSSYETFRNIFRNSLYGASLTDSEIKAFNKAAGTLGQKFQPAMARMNTQMRSIKNQLETIRDTQDPYIAHFYLGKDITFVDDAIRRIDERLDLVKSYKPPETKLKTKDVMKRKPLSEILGGS